MGAIIQGDPDAAAILWDVYSPVVRGTLQRMLGPDSETEDLVQEVFLRLFSGAIHALRDPDKLKSFLAGMAARVSRKKLRWRRVRRFVGLSDTGVVPDVEALRRDDDARDALRRLYAILDGLDVKGRQAFVLRFIEGRELTEVAELLGVSLNTAKRRLEKVTSLVHAKAMGDPVLSEYLLSGEEDPRSEPGLTFWGNLVLRRSIRRGAQ